MNRFLLLLGCILAFSSCAPKLMFSEEERLKLVENGMDIRTVQFFNDKEIVLRRKMNSTDLSVRGGVIKTLDGSQVEEIRIMRYTPALVDSFSNGRLYVRFERGDDRQLIFYRNTFSMYQIDAEKWLKGKGKVEYAGKVFFIENVGNDALLVVKKTKEYRNATSSKRVEGMKVGDRKRDTGSIKTLEETEGKSEPVQDSEEGSEEDEEEEDSEEDSEEEE